MRAPLVILSLLSLSLASSLRAEDKHPVYTDPAKAGPDYSVQGEYVGDDGGAQVIALGDGKFHIVGWAPGLPGASPQAERKTEMDAAREGDKVVFKNDDWKGEIVGDKITATNKDGKTVTAKHTMRKSPTEMAPPPAGALVLFDGKNVDEWENGKILPGDVLQCGVKTKKAFKDFTLHVEFLLPFKPFARGQERGNSGVYLQDRYEVQVLDSFGLSGAENECGAIYEIAKPLVNMCLPALQWQTYDIDFTAAKYDAAGKKTANAFATVRQNGVLVQDHTEIPRATRSAGHKEGPEPAPLYLQLHNNPVVYRNIWIVEKKS